MIKILKNFIFVGASKRRCEICVKDIPTSRYAGHLRSLQHRANSCTEQGEGIQLARTSFQCRIATYRLIESEDPTNVKRFMDHLKEKFIKLMGDNIIYHQNVKVGVELFGRFLLQTSKAMEVKAFNIKFKTANENTDMEELYEQFVSIIDQKATEFAQKESGKNFVFILINLYRLILHNFQLEMSHNI